MIASLRNLLLFSVGLSACATKSDAADRTAYDGTVYDVVVYGGTATGLVAAVQAARMGKSVVLLSFDDFVGGLTSGGLTATDVGNRDSIGGIAAVRP